MLTSEERGYLRDNVETKGEGVARLLWTLALTCSALLDPAHAQQSQSFNFGAWLVECVQPPEGRQQCQLTQRVIDGARRMQILNFSVVHLSDSGEYAMSITVPHNVLLEPGAGIRFDEDDIIEYSYTRCMPAGCLIETRLEAEVVAKLKSADAAQMVVVDLAQKPVAIPLSLQEFGPAVDKLKAETRKGEPMWSPLTRVWGMVFSSGGESKDSESEQQPSEDGR